LKANGDAWWTPNSRVDFTASLETYGIDTLYAYEIIFSGK